MTDSKNSLLSAFLTTAVVFATLACPQAFAMPDCKPLVLDVLAGEPVPMEMMVDDLATVRVVYVGEVHTIRLHHRLQAEVLRALTQRDLKLALGMEMFSTKQQRILNEWQRGQGSVESLVNDLGQDVWTNLLDYKSVLLSARSLRIPILAINAEDSLVKKVARNGISGLTVEERRQMPRGFDRIDPLNDRLLRLKLRVHKAFEGKSLDRIVLAQALRDATMARTIVRFLNSPEGKGRTMMVIAGSGHLNYGLGIPDRVQERAKFSNRIVIPSESGELVLTEAEKRQAVPLDITHKDLRFINRPISDYLYVIPLREKQRKPATPQRSPKMDQARLTTP